MDARTLAAIAACARTLADGGDAEALVERAGTTTVGPLRAYADRVALTRRYVDPAIEACYRPAEPRAALLYDALGAARVDALGVLWLRGVASNLLAHPGRDEDGVRWLAFEQFSHHAAPPEKAALVARARRAMTSALVDELRAFASVLRDQSEFFVAAAAWCIRASGEAPLPVAHVAERGFAIPNRPGGVDVRRGRYMAPGRDSKTHANNSAGESEGGAGSSTAPADLNASHDGYRVYTTASDRVTNAVALTGRDDLARLRMALDAEFG
ncbi:MAG: hypothetical protein LBQ09_09885, partial [Acidobacteriaceae bacterium]|nr:hypothetical protein [Acidobacteriaceae bacterium]